MENDKEVGDLTGDCGKNLGKYRRLFGIDSVDREINKNALASALDIRKFEIDLYWKRATYFWALIAVAFAGYFAILGSVRQDGREFNAFVIANIGYVFSVSWFFVNRGSKFWQENWENHVDMLEDGVNGPLYKTILTRPKATKFFEKYVNGPLPISVSKINQWVSLFVILIWIFLAFNVVPKFSRSSSVDFRYVVVAILSVGFSIAVFFGSRTKLDGHKHSMTVKKISIIDDKKV